MKAGFISRLAPALLLVLVCQPAFSLDPSKRLTQYVHRTWQLPQGLPDATITSILQTHDDYLWLGTETGLVRFDGVRFSALDDTGRNPLEQSWVRSLMEDRYNQIWIGTNEDGFLSLKDGVALQSWREEGLEHASVPCLLTDKSRDMWACTSNGIARLTEGKLVVYRTAQGLPSNDFRAACEAADGSLWFGGDGSKLSVWNGSGFSTHNLTSMPSYGVVRALLCSPDGALWIGTTNGLIRLKDGKERLYTVKDGLADDWIYCLLRTPDDSLWIGTKNGFSRLRNGEMESFRTEDGLSQSTVYSLYEDHEGSLWVGTKRGLNQFIDGRSVPYTVSEGLPSNNTGPILQDRAGAVWIGTLGAGLCRFEGRHCRTLTTKDGLAGNSVYSLAEDDAGDVWVGTEAGLTRLREGRIYQTYTTANGLPADRIRFLSHDHMGRLWIGTAAGLTLYVDGKFVQPKGIREASLPSILGGGEDRDGRFFATTEAGASVFAEGRAKGEFRPFTPDNMPLRGVDAFYADPDGLLWMGTLGSGLRLLKGGEVFSYLMRDGLFDNEIYSIIPDDQDRLWMASSKGIFSVKRSDLRKFANHEIQKFVSTPYSPLDGLRTIQCKSDVQPAAWKMRDGKLWFSTIRGLLVINPDRLQLNAGAPSIAIEDVRVNGQSESADRIGKMAPGRKDLEVRYTALSFLVPNGLTFRYILDGYDTQWIDAGNRRVAYYTNLPPGQFRFRVTACNSDGICNESGRVVGFSVARHYYQRPWFFPLCAVLLAAAGWLGWRQYVGRLRQRFEIVLAERSRIARELHDTLIQGFSGITMGMQAVALGLPRGEEQSQLRELIHDAANSLKQARESVAGLRGTKETHLELDGAIAEVARQITGAKDVELKLKLEQGPPDLGAEIEYNLLRIVQEALTNAMKHSGATTIEVGLHCTPELIGLSVHDNGKGFDQEDNCSQPGHYGLAGMRERASEIGAEFELVTEPENGTTVRLMLARSRGRNGDLRTETVDDHTVVR